MAKEIALFGGSLNPPHLQHLEVVRRLRDVYERTVVVPSSGGRPDKLTVNDIDAVHRGVMADMTFGRLPGAEVDLFDLENEEFTAAVDLERRYWDDETEVWNVVGSDLVVPGRDGRPPQIIDSWRHGSRIWNEFNWAVIERPGYPLDGCELPPNSRVYDFGFEQSSSTDVRRAAFDRQPLDGLVTPEVARWIERYGLYRGGPTRNVTRLRLDEFRPYLYYYSGSEMAVRIAEAFRGVAVSRIEDANCVLVAGGDGTMLRAVPEFWRTRLPLIGLNAGHRGALMSTYTDAIVPDGDWWRELDVIMSPLIRVDYVPAEDEAWVAAMRELVDVEFSDEEERDNVRSWATTLGRVVGRRSRPERSSFYAFNDAWVERACGQSARLRLLIDGEEVSNNLVGDGLLVATPAGSSGYAESMGARPEGVDSSKWLMAGNNVSRATWTLGHSPLSREAVVTVEVLEPLKRPVRLRGDFHNLGLISRMEARLSRCAAVELAFVPGEDHVGKRYGYMYPR